MSATLTAGVRSHAEEEEDKEMRDGDYDGLERSTFDEAPRPFLCSRSRLFVISTALATTS